MYQVDFNPCWGTRVQHVDRHILGPFSTREKAEKVRDQILFQMKWPEDTPRVTIKELKADEPTTFQIGGGPYKTLKIVP